MLHKMMMLARFGLGVPMFANIAREDDETLGLIELDDNLGDVEKPEELPPGNYTGEIQDVSMGTSQKGNKYFNIKFVIPTSEIPADKQDQFEDGAILYYNRIIVPTGKDRRALFNLKNFIEKLGLNTNTTTVDPNEWMGQNARLKVVHETYQGEKRAAIKSVEAAEGATQAKGKTAAASTKARGRK